MSDQDLPIVECALQGDLEAFTRLVRKYEQPIVNFLYRMLFNREDALEVGQEVFLKVYQSLDRFNPQYRFSTWLFAIARNAAIDFLRRSDPAWLTLDASQEKDPQSRSVREPQAEENLSPESTLLRGELGRRIEEAISRLPLPYREVLILRYMNDLAYEEIAAMLELPLGTVKNRLFRARELLRERLQNL